MKTWLVRHARSSSVVAIVVVVLIGGAFVGWTALRSMSSAAPGGPAGTLSFVELDDGLSQVERVATTDPGGPRSTTSLKCLRAYSAGGTTICMKISGPGPTYAADITDSRGALLQRVSLPGIPSRARVSASGRIVTWTSFVTGDSYSLPGGFSTRTGYFDVRTGELEESIEKFDTQLDGAPVVAVDRNYWGLTVAADDHTVYATLGTGGRTWLLRGDLTTKALRAIHPSAECPSLSPDGTRVAFKKRTSRLGPWELVVLDLSRGTELALPGTEGMDDQAEWLNNAQLAYGAVPRDGRVSAVFMVAADGSTPAQMIIPNAASPFGTH